MEVFQTILTLVICSFYTTSAKSVAGFKLYPGKGNLSSGVSDANAGRMARDEVLGGSTAESENAGKERRKRDSQLQFTARCKFAARCKYILSRSKRSPKNHKSGEAAAKKRNLNMAGKVVIEENNESNLKPLPSYHSFAVHNGNDRRAIGTPITTDKLMESHDIVNQARELIKEYNRKATQRDLSSENVHSIDEHDPPAGDLSYDKETPDSVPQKTSTREHKHDKADGQVDRLLDDAAHIDQESTQLKTIAKELDIKAGLLRTEAIASAIHSKGTPQLGNKQTLNATGALSAMLPKLKEITSPSNASTAERMHEIRKEAAEGSHDTREKTAEGSLEFTTQEAEGNHEARELTVEATQEAREQTTEDTHEPHEQSKQVNKATQESQESTNQITSTEEYFAPRKNMDIKNNATDIHNSYRKQEDVKGHAVNVSTSTSPLAGEKIDKASRLEERRHECSPCYPRPVNPPPVGNPCNPCYQIRDPPPKVAYNMNNGAAIGLNPSFTTYNRPLIGAKPLLVGPQRPCLPMTGPLIPPQFNRPCQQPVAQQVVPSSAPVVVSLKLPPGGPKKYVLTLKEIVNKTIIYPNTKQPENEATKGPQDEPFKGNEGSSPSNSVNPLNDMPPIGNMGFKEAKGEEPKVDTEGKGDSGPEKGEPIEPKKDSTKANEDSSTGPEKGAPTEPKKESPTATEPKEEPKVEPKVEPAADSQKEPMKPNEDAKTPQNEPVKANEDTNKTQNKPTAGKAVNPLNDMPNIGSIEPKKDGSPIEPKIESKIEAKLDTEGKGDAPVEGKIESKLDTEAKGGGPVEAKIEPKLDTEAKGGGPIESKIEPKLDTEAKVEGKIEPKLDTEAKGDKATEGKLESKLDTEGKGDKAVEPKLDIEVKGGTQVEQKLDTPVPGKNENPPQETKVDKLMGMEPKEGALKGISPQQKKEEGRLDYPLGLVNHAKREHRKDALVGLWEEASINMKSNESKRSEHNKGTSTNAGSKNGLTLKITGNEDAQIWTEPWTEPILPHYRAKKYQSPCSRFTSKEKHDLEEDCLEQHSKTEK